MTTRTALVTAALNTPAVIERPQVVASLAHLATGKRKEAALTRDELNDLAREAGVASPEELPNKVVVEEAMKEAGEATPLRAISVVDAVEEDLQRIAARDPKLGRSGLAATAFALARDLDNPKNSATSKSMCAKALSEVLDRLLELAPEAPKKDRIDDLSARRAARRAAS